MESILFLSFSGSEIPNPVRREGILVVGAPQVIQNKKPFCHR